MIKHWVWLSQIKGIGYITQRMLVKHFGDPQSVFNATRSDLSKVYGLNLRAVKRVLESRSFENTENILRKSERFKIKIIPYNHELVPKSVKEQPDLPCVLYYIGSIRKENEGIAIIGSRRCTSYGKAVTKEAAEFLAGHNIAVISGMAKGIDGYAHTACIKVGGYTLAFLGNGLDICYPEEHRSLMERIIESGAVISPYPPETKAFPGNFHIRNGLISAWAKKLLVVEAAEKSGTFITVEYAKKYKKQIFAVPNSIYCKGSIGTNQLIYEGAQIYISPNQLIDDMKESSFESQNIIQKKADKQRFKTIKTDNRFAINASLEVKILKCIEGGAEYVDMLMDSLPAGRNEIMEALCILDLEEKI